MHATCFFWGRPINRSTIYYGMPRYYFHFLDPVEVEDPVGCECPDEAAARALAIDEARALAADGVRDGLLDLRHRIEVNDGRGTILFAISFADVVAISC